MATAITKFKLVILFLALPLLASATTYTFSGTGDWGDTLRWSPSIPPATLLAGDTVQLDASANCTVSSLNQVILAGAVMEVATGAVLTVQSGQGFNVFGSFNNDGTFELVGELTMEAGSTGDGGGALNLNNGFLVLRNSNGDLPGNSFNWALGTFVIGSGATYTATGDFIKPVFSTFTLEPNATFVALQDFRVENIGVLFSQGNITVHGAFVQGGDVNNYGIFTLLGTCTFNSSLFVGSGMLNIHGVCTGIRLPNCPVQLFGTYKIAAFVDAGQLNFNLLTMHAGALFIIGQASTVDVSQSNSLNIPPGTNFIVEAFAKLTCDGTINNQGNFNLDGELQLGGYFTNAGSFNQNGTLSNSPNSVLTLTTGTNFNTSVDFTNAGTLNLGTNNFNCSGLFSNLGTLNLNGGSDFSNTSNFVSNGTVNLSGGTLRIVQSANVFFNWSSGSLTIVNGATLTATGNFAKPFLSNMNLEPNASFVALQDFRVENIGVLFSQGNITVHGAFVQGGDVNNYGIFTLLGTGTFTSSLFVGSGVLNIHGVCTGIRLPNCPVQLFGTYKIAAFSSAGQMSFNSFTMHPGASFIMEIASTGFIHQPTTLSVPPGATVLLENGAKLTCDGTIHNQGSLNLNGELQLGGFINNTGNLINDGSFNLNTGATLVFNNTTGAMPGGAFNWASGSSVIVENGTTVSIDAPLNIPTGRQLAINGTLQINAALTNAGNLDLNAGGKLLLNTSSSAMPGGNFNWSSGGTFSIGSGGQLNLSTLLNIGSGRLLEVQPSGSLNHTAGTLTVQSGGLLDVDGILNNSANLTISGGGNVTNAGETNHTGGTLQVLGLLANTGTLNLAASFTLSSGGNLNNTGEVNHTAGSFQVAGNITNSRDMNNGAGLTIVNGGNCNNTGSFNHTGGTIQIITGGALTNASGGEFTNNANITNLGSFNNNGSYLGGGIFNGFFQNSAGGTFSPGNSPGCHSFGNSMGNAGTILMEIGGATFCDEHDRFGVAESANLGGSLQIQLVNGFVPSAGQEFTLLLADFISGTFSSVQFPGGTTGTVLYFANEVKVKFQGILPVELLDFQAFAEGEKIRLAWKTASEQNNEGFFLERLSVDGLRWTEIGFVAGNGTTTTKQSYQFYDEKPLPGVNYYRLRQMDFDGREEFSEVVSLDFPGFENLESLVRVFPNPVTGGELTLVLPGDFEEEIIAEIFDTTGRLMRSIPIRGGVNSIDLQGLGTGIYTLMMGQYQERILIRP
ncbi:MAG: hypothetical protein IPN76_19020 [Saprospiraceae bacterium]|nr:hypothetical protein [Saprospiraceae bacterium]